MDSAPNIMEDSLEFDENLTPMKRSTVPTLEDVKENEPFIEDKFLKNEEPLHQTNLANGIDLEPEKTLMDQDFYNEISTISSKQDTEQGLDEEALRQKHMQEITANEIFTDGGLDFLENKGTSPTESELARQSLFVKFDPLVGTRSVPLTNSSSLPNSAEVKHAPETAAFSLPAMQTWNNGIKINSAFASQSHADTTNYIAAMQKKQQAISKQIAASKAAENPLLFSGSSVNGGLLNGSGDHLLADDVSKTTPISSQPLSDPGLGAPGSLVNLVDTPQRPVALRVKNNSKTVSHQKMMNRRSVPAAFLDNQLTAFDVDLNQNLHIREDVLELPEIPPVWENVIATYETLVQTLIAKLQRFQEETNEAKQREARAVKEQEEMHRVFVGLHERFEASKAIIGTYKANQETLQNAFDELNAEFQPLVQENKKMQAAIRLHDMKVRQMEVELEKRREENAELTKIVDDLISKDS